VRPPSYAARVAQLVGTPPLLRAASFYAALPSTTAVATPITATAVVIATTLKAEVTTADPEAEVGARSRSLSRSAGGSTSRIRFLSVHLSSGKRGSAHHSLRRRVTCYRVLRMGAPEHSPWRAPRDDLNDSSYQQQFPVWLTHASCCVHNPHRMVCSTACICMA
jgi:hypothetical protein